jgi:hypothetical protein
MTAISRPYLDPPSPTAGVAWLSQAGVSVQAQLELGRGDAVACFLAGGSHQKVRYLTLVQVDTPIGARYKELVFTVGTRQR